MLNSPIAMEVTNRSPAILSLDSAVAISASEAIHSPWRPSLAWSAFTHAMVIGCFATLLYIHQDPHDHPPLVIDVVAISKNPSAHAPSMVAPPPSRALPRNPIKHSLNESSAKKSEETPSENTSISSAPTAPGIASTETAAGALVASASAKQIYVSELRAFLERNKRYPSQALTLGQEGTVKIRFQILEDGTLTEATVAQTSGSSILDQAAMKLVRGLVRFKPIPEGLVERSLSLIVPIEYRIQ